MISFRYHVVSLVAVLLALAVGVVLGGGPLQRPAAAGPADDADAVAAAEERARALEAELALADGYAAGTAPLLLRGTLSDRAVALVLLPGVDRAAVEAVAGAVGDAGGAVTARLQLSEELLDATNRQLVTTLAAQLEETAGRAVDVPEGASGYDRMGALLAHAVTTTRDGGRRPDGAGQSVLAGLATAELVQGEQGVRRRGSLVLVLAGEPAGSADARQGAGSITASLASALDAAGDGVVLAGPVGSAAEDGVVGAVRADGAVAEEVSTVDVLGTAHGAVVTVLAADAEADGRPGHHGGPDAPDGAVPRPAGRR